VTASQEDWSGDYLIAAQYANNLTSFVFVANGKIGGTASGGIGNSGSKKEPDTALSGNAISASWGDSYYVTVSKVEGGYVMQTQDGKFNYTTGSNNSIATTENLSTAASHALTFTFVSDSEIRIAGDGNMVLQFGSSAFRFFTSGTETPVYLYKKSMRPSGYSLAVPESVTVTSARYATYCATQDLDFSTTGIRVYTAKATATAVELTEVTDGIVPAGTGVVLYSDEATTVAVPVVKSSKTGLDDNELTGTTGRTQVNASADGKTNYILANEPGSGIGFYKATGGYLAANRAYLSTPTAAAGSARFLQIGSGEATGIGATGQSTRTDGSCFDLQGRRMAQPQRGGLYIVDGRKVVMNEH